MRSLRRPNFLPHELTSPAHLWKGRITRSLCRLFLLQRALEGFQERCLWMKTVASGLKLLSQVQPGFTKMSPSFLLRSMVKFTTYNKPQPKGLSTISILNLFFPFGVAEVETGSSPMFSFI